jgi:DNA-binding NarL/FixJ family response regulator
MSDSVEQLAKIRILVLDDQPLLRHGISAYLNSQPDMVVCGEAESVADARSKIAECQPQVLVTPLRLGGQDSLKFIKKLKTENARLRILVYSAFEESIFAERAMRAGASGYLMTQAPTDALASAIREIVGGGIYVSREVALSAFRKSLRPIPKHNYGLRSAGCLEELSNREMHVFQLLGSGLTNRQIAASLDLSVKTVESHQENIKHKLYISSCAEVRKRAANWMEQSFNAEEHLFRGTSGRKRRVPSTAFHVVEAFDAQQMEGSQVAPDSAATGCEPASVPTASYAVTKS